jgi:hypothetical protein
LRTEVRLSKAFSICCRAWLMTQSLMESKRLVSSCHGQPTVSQPASPPGFAPQPASPQFAAALTRKDILDRLAHCKLPNTKSVSVSHAIHAAAYAIWSLIFHISSSRLKQDSLSSSAKGIVRVIVVVLRTAAAGSDARL